jgi:glycerol-3-phosphate acyltransferase PlsY
MILNETTTIIIAIILAYLLGSIPFAYIFTHFATGQDIRQLGSGNGGAHNVFHEVGLKIAIPVALFDLGKSSIAVCLAYMLLDVTLFETNTFVLLAALAVIAGHMWPVYLKFKGGNGLSAVFGALAFVMPWELSIAIGCLLILIPVTHNLVLSTNLGLLSIPISTWFIHESLLFVGFSILVTMMLVLHFIPTAKKALAKAENKEDLIHELLRKEKG